MMSDSVSEVMRPTDSREKHLFVPHFHSGESSVRKDRPDRCPVLGSQEEPPESESQLRHDSIRSDLSLLFLDSYPGSKNVFHQARAQQSVGVVEPIRPMTLPDRPRGHRRVNRIAQDHFDIGQHFEQRPRHRGIPLVQPDRSHQITITGIEVGSEPVVGQSLGEKFGVDVQRWERRSGSRLDHSPT